MDFEYKVHGLVTAMVLSRSTVKRDNRLDYDRCGQWRKTARPQVSSPMEEHLKAFAYTHMVDLKPQ